MQKRKTKYGTRSTSRHVSHAFHVMVLIVVSSLISLSAPSYHRTRPWTHSGTRGATSARDRHTHTGAITRRRSLQRPNRTKSAVSRMRNATWRCPESQGSPAEAKGAMNASLGPTTEVSAINERCRTTDPNELRACRNAARHFRGVRDVLGMR